MLSGCATTLRRRRRAPFVVAFAAMLGGMANVAVGPAPWHGVLAADPYASTVLADHPLGYWRLGESSGTTALDSSGNGHNGTYVGGVTLGAPSLIGSGGTAATFNGTGYVDLGTLNLNLSAVTLEAWVKPTSYASTSPYIDSVVGTETTDDNNALLLRLGYGGLAANAGKPDLVATTHQGSPSAEAQASAVLAGPGTAHYVVGVFSDPSLTVYVDGNVVASVTASPTDGHAYGTADYWIAGNPLFGRYFNGVMDDVAIYPSALSRDRVVNHYITSGYYAPPQGGNPSTAETEGNGGNFCWKCFARRSVQGSWAEPIDSATGNYSESYTDLVVPGRGIPRLFTHSYNALAASNNGPLGFGWTFDYAMSLNQTGSTVTVNGPNGSQVIFTLSGTAYTAPPRVQATLVKNQDGTFTFTQDLRETFTFNASGQLTQEKDLNGYVTSLAYNGSGELTTVTDPAQRALTLAYTGGQLTSVTDPVGRKVGFAYNDGAGDLTDVTDIGNGVTHYTYDSNHLLLTVTDPRNHVVTTNHYDASNRVASQADGLQRTTTFAYSGTPLTAAGGSTTITDPKGNVSVEQYVNGERVSLTRGYGTAQAATWQYRYDPASLKLVGGRRSRRTSHHQPVRRPWQPAQRHRRARAHDQLWIRRAERPDQHH